ncbi:MAG: hypothetical protein KGS72_18400 [Cyanobacteria bacterium REEB67]|nr:hypothetical protein [Cyanobacteria bacterium REEB67]
MSTKKKMDHKTKVRILVGAIGFTFIVLIYQVIHCFEVLKEAQDPDSPNARAAHLYHGPTQAEIDADDRFFKAREAAPLRLEARPAPSRSNTATISPKPASPAASTPQ